MSVLVKDMRFPNYCSDCEFSKLWGNSGTYCSRHPERESVKYGEGKPEWCPIADVPTPHGRLIEAEPLIDYCKRFIEAYDYRKSLQDKARRHELLNMVGEIASAPTIIEAEES